MEPNLLDESVIRRIVTEINNSEERDRKRQAFDAYQVCSGNLKPYVESELMRTRPKSWRSYSISNISLSKMVTRKLAKSYSNEPIREVKDQNGEPSEIKTEAIHQWYDQAQANRQFKELDNILNLHKHALMWVNWRQMEQKWHFMALAPYEFSVIRNKDTGKLLTVILKYPDTTITSSGRSQLGVSGGDGIANWISESQTDSAGQSMVYAMWNSTQHVVIKANDEEIKNERGETHFKLNITYAENPDNPDMVNPLGMIPFVYYTKDNSPDFPTINPITEQTITMNALFSELLTASNIQGTSIFTMSYPESMQGNMENVSSGITSGIELPQKEDSDIRTEADFISPNPDLANQKDVYTAYLRMILAEHGITNSQGLDGASAEMHPSALDRIIANADVQSAIYEMQQTLYEPAEKEVFNIMKAWLRNVLNDNTISETDELMIKFPKPKIMISDKETLENIDKRLAMGLMHDWEALMAIDPNLSEKEARQKIEDIKSERGMIFNARDNQENNPRPIEGAEGSESES